MPEHVHPIRRFRKDHGLTLAAFAADADGLSEQSISRIERGEQNPSLGAIKKLSRAAKGVVTEQEILEAALRSASPAEAAG